MVSAAEVTRDILGGDSEAELEAGGHYELEYEDAEGGDQVMRTNRETVDDPLAQKMSWVEIEELKRQGTGSGRVLYYCYVSTVPQKKTNGLRYLSRTWCRNCSRLTRHSTRRPPSRSRNTPSAKQKSFSAASLFSR